MDGVVISSPATCVGKHNRLTLNSQPVVGQPNAGAPLVALLSACLLGQPHAEPPQLLLYNKPPSMLVSRTDPDERARRTIFDELEQMGLPRALKSVGRLDYMSSGLLLLTNDGELARGLERSKLPRCYRVKGARCPACRCGMGASGPAG